MVDDKVGITGKLHRDWSSNQDFIISFCTMIRHKVFEQIGYFDSIFNPYFGEDVDFCIRAKVAGWKIANVSAMPLYHKSHTEGNPTAKNAQVISQKSNILRERYNSSSFGSSNSIWDISLAATNHYNSDELANALVEFIPKKDLVIDLGCGNGYYCNFLENRGYTVIAVEGTKDIEKVSLYKPIFRWNLTQDLILPGLPEDTTVLSLEVAEHIDPAFENVFFNNITKHATRVIMSWGVPGQGGDGHVNERPNDYVINRMRERGFLFDRKITEKLRLSVFNSKLWWFKNTLMVFEKVSVTVVIPTRDRYFTTLPQCILSIANQTYKPEKIIIYDDGEQKDLRQEPMYRNIFSLLAAKGIYWAVNFGARKGQAYSHQKSIEDAKTTWIWRIDDDNIAEPDVLAKLVSNIDSDVGAVGGLVIDPKSNGWRPSLASNKIEDIYLGLNIQWFRQEKKVEEVDHLYSTFIFRKSAAKEGYDLRAPIHREETIFSYRIKRAGWCVLVDTSAITWHFNEQTGGIRDDKREKIQECERVFAEHMKEWGIKPNEYKFIVLDNGLGDHLIFKKVLPEIRARNKGKKLVMAVCYPEVFEDDKDVKLISIGEAKGFFGKNYDTFNTYKWMWDRNWNKPLELAFAEQYR
jgi:GT2 family glycosyltransferase